MRVDSIVPKRRKRRTTTAPAGGRSPQMPKRKVSKDAILKSAREHFGFDSLRPGQEEAITAVLQGRDTLVVQPTGRRPEWIQISAPAGK